MKKITQFSVDYPITIIMAVLAVLLMGYISFTRLGMDLFPDVTNPSIYVELKSGELPPEEIERKFVENIEAQAARQKSVVNVSSVSRVGTARITVEYAWNTDMDEAFLNLQKALTSFKQDSDIDELSITQYDPNASPIILLSLSNPEITDMDELRKTAESYLRNELIRLEGIADVRILGQEEKEVLIETDPYMLEAYGVTAASLASRINEYNRNISGGSIEEMGRQYIIKGVGEITSLDDIMNIVVTYKTSTTTGESTTTTGTTSTSSERVPVYLRDLAKVSFRNTEPDNIVRLNGKRCMGLAVYKEMKYNTVQAVDEFMTALEGIKQVLPGYELTVVQNQGTFITQAVGEVKQTAVFGIILAIIILYIFLRRIGTTFVVSIAIPISIIATFNLMYFNDLTLNIMTLGGLALGAGMLVDNAIVVMENITRHLESGSSLREAAILGTAQVGGAITASTLTTIVVFLPIVYLHGSAGELFREQAWTVAFSLISSLAVAILVIPVLSKYFMKKHAVKPGAERMYLWYSTFLKKTLSHRWTILLASIALVVLSLRLLPLIGSEFIPKTEMNEFSIELTLPEGTELLRTSGTVGNIEDNIRSVFGDNVESIFSISGPSGDVIEGSGTVFEDENTAIIKVILKKEHGISSETVANSLAEIIGSIPDVEARVAQEQAALQFTLGNEDAPVVVEIRGEDLDVLQDLADQAKTRLTAINDLYNVESTFEEGRPEIDVVIDRVNAGLKNISIDAVANQLNNRLMGAESGQMEDGGEMKDIIIELPKIAPGQLDMMTIESGGQEVRLYEIANIVESSAPKEIDRANQTRISKITANIRSDVPLDRTVREIEAAMSGIAFPVDYRYTIAGEEQKRREAFQNLKFALLLSLVLVYMVLASQFESLIHPFTIILSIPFAAVGAILLFFIIGKPFNIMAYIGIIMLAGIAVNDSIILVDAINQLRGEGMSRRDAIGEAGRRRIRPIIMTSLTTIMALLPLTFGFGEGAALRAPMAIAVIGGLVTSTLLTLLVIPSIYDIFDGLRFGKRD